MQKQAEIWRQEDADIAYSHAPFSCSRHSCSSYPCVSIRGRLAIFGSTTIRELLSPTDRSTRMRPRAHRFVYFAVHGRLPAEGRLPVVWAKCVSAFNTFRDGRFLAASHGQQVDRATREERACLQKARKLEAFATLNAAVFHSAAMQSNWPFSSVRNSSPSAATMPLRIGAAGSG